VDPDATDFHIGSSAARFDARVYHGTNDAAHESIAQPERAHGYEPVFVEHEASNEFGSENETPEFDQYAEYPEYQDQNAGYYHNIVVDEPSSKAHFVNPRRRLDTAAAMRCSHVAVPFIDIVQIALEAQSPRRQYHRPVK
jgi:hypothetical protein